MGDGFAFLQRGRMGQGQSGPKITAQDKAILDLKLQRDSLKRYQKRIEGVLKAEKEAAKEALAAGHKQRALTALRRRKYQETLLLQTDQQLATLQDLVSSIEFSLVEKDVLYGLRQGTSVLKELNKEMNVESVEKLMGETAEAIAYQQEVDEMLQSRMCRHQSRLPSRRSQKEKRRRKAGRLPWRNGKEKLCWRERILLHALWNSRK